MENQELLGKTFRLLGILPLLIFVYRLAQYISVGTPDWIMYNCHLSTLLLAVAMFTGWKLGIRIAAIWLVIGLPMWLIDAWVTQVLWIASVTSHLGGFLLAMYAIRKIGATGKSWLPALAWFLFWQLVTRYTTAPELNVNIAHTPYESCKTWFGSSGRSAQRFQEYWFGGVNPRWPKFIRSNKALSAPNKSSCQKKLFRLFVLSVQMNWMGA